MKAVVRVAPAAILRALRYQQGFRFNVAIAVLCDNSFDADAKRIEIHFLNKKEFMVKDDGNGCNDIQKMLTPGYNFKRQSANLGAFSCWLWGELLVSTIHKGVKRSARVDWEQIAAQNDWKIPDPIETLSQEKGTELLFRHITRKLPDIQKLKNELGYFFASALKDGKQIIIYVRKNQPILCTASEMPPMEDMIKD